MARVCGVIKHGHNSPFEAPREWSKKAGMEETSAKPSVEDRVAFKVSGLGSGHRACHDKEALGCDSKDSRFSGMEFR